MFVWHTAHAAVAHGTHAGPMFRLPVTVIKPKRVSSVSAGGEAPSDYTLSLPNRSYTPGAIDRHFIAVPAGATWAELSFKTREVEGSHMLVLHALQVLALRVQQYLLTSAKVLAHQYNSANTDV